jgi:hypothetical protein
LSNPAYTGKPQANDPGLTVLVMLLRFHGVSTDPAQVLHRFGPQIGVPEMLRCAKELGLKARAFKSQWPRLASIALPAIAVTRDGGFLLLAKASDDKVLVQDPLQPRPALMTRAELEACWTGDLVLMTRRASLVDLSRRFDITWFLGAISKYRSVLYEVLVASFFLQLFGLVSPLFFQVVIDKVWCTAASPPSMSGDRPHCDSLFEAIRVAARLHIPHHQPDRRRARGAAVSAPARPAARVFQARRVGDSVARVRELENSHLPHQLGADPGHRSVLHLCFCGGDVFLLGVADLGRAGKLSLLYRDLGRRDPSVSPPPRREISAGRRKPGVSGRKHHRGRTLKAVAVNCWEGNWPAILLELPRATAPHKSDPGLSNRK